MSSVISFFGGFAERWLGTALPRIFLLFVGLLLCILVVTALWDKRVRGMGAMAGFAVAAVLAALSFEESLLHYVGSFSGNARLRLLGMAVASLMLCLTLVAWRRGGLRRHFVLMWSAVCLLVLLTAVSPGVLAPFPMLLGANSWMTAQAVVFFFLILLVFHLSIAVSRQDDEQRLLRQRLLQVERHCGLPAVASVAAAADRSDGAWHPAFLCTAFAKRLRQWRAAWKASKPVAPVRTVRGTAVAAPLVVGIAVIGVFLTGMAAPQVMVGDEVTHYYMLSTQAEQLPAPNFFARIPHEWGDEPELRRYPHPFLWHYFGAIVHRISAGSFAAVQLYQALFLLQFLAVAYLLARDRQGVHTRSALLYLLVLASLPMSIIFSVTFYQDIPMAAQVLSAFFFLRRKRWLVATFFLCLALGIKVNALLFLPAFLICLAVWTWRRDGLRRAVVVTATALLLLVSSAAGMGAALRHYGQASYYPVDVFRKLIGAAHLQQDVPFPPAAVTPPDSRESRPEVSGKTSKKPVISEQYAEVIANHPGDLRIKQNYFVYGGMILWLIMLMYGVSLVFATSTRGRRTPPPYVPSQLWLWLVGLSYTLAAVWFLRTAPDARFFLPGLPFLLLPMAEKVVGLPYPRVVIATCAALAILQSGYVFAKTYHLRHVSDELQATISYLRLHPPEPRTVFMYPEGNYRLFTVPHEWYLRYRLREFWQADNDARLAVFRTMGIGAIVVKKHLVADVDENITDLGVYPSFFVKQIEADRRFRKVFDNAAAAVYLLPRQ